MFLMRNEVGNIYKRVSTVSKKEELEKLGYSVVSGEAVTAEPAPKRLDDTDSRSIADKLKKMKKEELKQYAEDNDIDLGDAKTNDEIVSAILEASEPETVI